jgi:predicted transcriptional regulator
VVHNARAKLAVDLVAPAAQRSRRVFSDAALDLYGIHELQTLEDVLRKNREEAIVTVAGAIRRKAGLPDDGDDYAFLSDYYAALCARLERGMMLGRRRDNKHSGWSRR